MPKTVAADAPRRRMKADDRRGLILQAARRAFSENGDMSGTTMRAISEAAGVSEGLIYRHFESKEQLYIEAVVDPLRKVTDKLVATAEFYDADRPETLTQRIDVMRGLTDDLVTTFTKILPLLGLVLFGDPRIARTFYREDLTVAMDRLAAAWKSVEGRYGFAVEAPDVSARSVMGICLMLALENEHNPDFDRARAVKLVTNGLANGFFPPITSPTKRATPKTATKAATKKASRSVKPSAS